MYALIAGTGVSPDNFTILEHFEVDTPWGRPSGPVYRVKLNESGEFLYLPRHGASHEYPPHLVPYRANIWALKKLGAKVAAALCTVGGIHPEMGAGGLMIPDQLIDYTYRRPSTFFDEPGSFKHVDMTNPFDDSMRRALAETLSGKGMKFVMGGTYGCTEGPRLETAAEIRRYKLEGCDVIGMTCAQEAVLSREAEIGYAALCVSVNHAAGIGESADEIKFAEIQKIVSAVVSPAVEAIVETFAE